MGIWKRCKQPKRKGPVGFVPTQVLASMGGAAASGRTLALLRGAAPCFRFAPPTAQHHCPPLPSSMAYLWLNSFLALQVRGHPIPKAVWVDLKMGDESHDKRGLVDGLAKPKTRGPVSVRQVMQERARDKQFQRYLNKAYSGEIDSSSSEAKEFLHKCQSAFCQKVRICTNCQENCGSPSRLPIKHFWVVG